MRRNLRQSLFCILSILLSAFSAFAGKNDYIHYKYPKPQVLLIQLSTEQNKSRSFEERQFPKRQAQLKQDIARIHRKIVADFSANFKFCQVYYFMDTNAHFIREGNYAAALLDTALLPVTPASFKAGQLYWIGAYSLGVNANTDQSLTAYVKLAGGETGMYRQRGDIAGSHYNFYLMGPDFTILPAPLPFTARISTITRIWKKITGTKYDYSSPLFELGYTETARYCNKTLNDFYYPKK